MLEQRHWIGIAGYGVVVSEAVLGHCSGQPRASDLHGDTAATISFRTLAFAHLSHIFSMRAPDASLSNDVTRNRYVWDAIVLCTGLLLVATYVSPIAAVRAS